MTANADPTKTRADKDLKHDRPLIACRFDPKGRYAFAGSEDNSVVRWELASGTRTILKAHESWPFALAVDPEGGTLLTGAGDGRLIWWPIAEKSPTPIRIIDAHAGWVNAIDIDPAGKFAATCGNDRRVRVWSLDNGSLMTELPAHEKPVYRVAFTPSGRTLISADLQGRVIEWDLALRKEARRLDAAKLYIYFAGQGVNYGGVRDLALSPDGKYLACCGLIEASNPLGAVSNPANLVFDWAVGKELRLQRPKADVKGVAWGVRFHPAGFIVMASGGTGGGFLWFFKPDQPNEFFQFNLGSSGRALDLHPDGLRLATAHHDGHLRIFTMSAPAKA